MRRVLLLLTAFALVLLVPGPSAGADDDEGGPWSGPTAVRVGNSAVSLHANARGSGQTMVWFEFGPPPGYASTTSTGSIKTRQLFPVTGTLNDLPAGTTYQVRLVVEAEGRRIEGPATVFSTRAATTAEPSAPAERAPAEPAPAEPAPARAKPAPAQPAPTDAAPAAAVTVSDSEPAPAPEQGSAVVASAAAGEIRVKVPGENRFESLDGLASVPVGSVVDAREGRIALSSETSAGTQTGEFWGAVFEVGQARGGGGMTELRLRGGSFAACRPAGVRTLAAAAAKGKRRKAVRKLWGKDKGGRFRTRGRDSVATVRGTTWTVADFCDRTVTRVAEGAVMVRDRHTGRRTLVRAGQRHVARHR